MSVKIRLMRIGTNRRPFYRVVAVDEHKKRTGGYLELLGTYNPLTEPKEINLDQGKIDAWMKKGAQPSEGFLRIIGKAPQRPPRKPKKAPKEAPAAPAAVTEESKESEVKAEKTISENSENPAAPEAQNDSESENRKSEITETPIQSDLTDSPSSSGSSEPETKTEENLSVEIPVEESKDMSEKSES